MISGNHYCFAKVLGTSIPERMAVIGFITEITYVTGEYEYISDR